MSNSVRNYMVTLNFSDDDLGKYSCLINVNMVNMCVCVSLISVPESTDTFRKPGVQFMPLVAAQMPYFLISYNQ
jgi:hypothetical protein